MNFQLKQRNPGFWFSASRLIWILASPPGTAGSRGAAPDSAEGATSVLLGVLGAHEHTLKTNCMTSVDQALHPEAHLHSHTMCSCVSRAHDEEIGARVEAAC